MGFLARVCVKNALAGSATAMQSAALQDGGDRYWR